MTHKADRTTDQQSLWDILDVPFGADRQQVDVAWSRSEKTEGQRQAWKILRDPFYSQMYADQHPRTDIQNIVRAGWFDDGLDFGVETLDAFDPSFICTPLNFDEMDLWSDNVILVTTGAFSPVHNGHIAMMGKARDLLIRSGLTVACGYMVPGHDSYVGQKYNGTAKIPAADRIHMLELATAEIPWLMVDPWAASYLPCEINFTDVLVRLQNYIEENTNKPTVLVYVYGSDNGDFQLAFKGKDRLHPKINGMVVDRTLESSTKARSGDHTMLNPHVASYMLGQHTPKTGVYQIRDDYVGPRALREEITKILSQAMEGHRISVLDLQQQINKASVALGDRNAISLDQFMNDLPQLGISRVFRVCDPQVKASHRTVRLGCEAPAVSLSSLSGGDYVLIDDDISTGGTMEHAMKTIEVYRPDITITEFMSINQLDEKQDDILDVVDLRDFVIGEEDSGLTVMSATILARVPYLQPWVNLHNRASIPVSLCRDVTLKILRANRDLGINKPLIKCGPLFKKFLEEMGPRNWEEMTLVDFCNHYISILETSEG